MFWFSRFYADTDSLHGVYKKNQINVDFPLTNLQMKEHTVPSYERRGQECLNYDLYSVSNHYGHMNRGHYTAFCKSPIFNKQVFRISLFSWVMET